MDAKARILSRANQADGPVGFYYDHALESLLQAGLLRAEYSSTQERVVYRITEAGRRALAQAGKPDTLPEFEGVGA